jgi:type VI secretion system ImpM family protein
MKVGFFGKLPSHGDFVQRKVSPALVEFWDNWLVQGIASSQEILGEGWQDAYYTSPLWHFTLSSGIVGNSLITGLMMPSVDTSGRAYPFTVFCELENNIDAFSLSSCFASTHEKVGASLIPLLQAQRVNLDDTRQACEDYYKKANIALKLVIAKSAACHKRIDTEQRHTELGRIESRTALQKEHAHFSFTADYLTHQGVRLSIWSYSASARFNYHTRYYEGMPHASKYNSLLHGQ